VTQLQSLRESRKCCTMRSTAVTPQHLAVTALQCDGHLVCRDEFVELWPLPAHVPTRRESQLDRKLDRLKAAGDEVSDGRAHALEYLRATLRRRLAQRHPWPVSTPAIADLSCQVPSDPADHHIPQPLRDIAASPEVIFQVVRMRRNERFELAKGKVVRLSSCGWRPFPV
jgi:hypothetical protein